MQMPAARKSNPDLYEEEDRAEVDKTPSRSPLESQVIAKSDRPEANDQVAELESLDSLRVNLTPFGPSSSPGTPSSVDIRLSAPPSSTERVRARSEEDALVVRPARPPLWGFAVLALLVAVLFALLR